MEAKTAQEYISIMKVVKDVLHSAGIQFWIDFGTLLCAYRDESIMRECDWDNSIFAQDVGVFRSIYPQLEQKLNEHGYEWLMVKEHLYGSPDNVWNISLETKPQFKDKRTHIHIDFYVWYPVNNWYTVFSTVGLYYAVPKKFFSIFREINIGDVVFDAPALVEEYLSYVYGEQWSTPLTWSEYRALLNEMVHNEAKRAPVHTVTSDIVEFWKEMGGGRIDAKIFWNVREKNHNQKVEVVATPELVDEELSKTPKKKFKISKELVDKYMQDNWNDLRREIATARMILEELMDNVVDERTILAAIKTLDTIAMLVEKQVSIQSSVYYSPTQVEEFLSKVLDVIERNVSSFDEKRKIYVELSKMADEELNRS